MVKRQRVELRRVGAVDKVEGPKFVVAIVNQKVITKVVLMCKERVVYTKTTSHL